jgi:hypothetical protein
VNAIEFEAYDMDILKEEQLQGKVNWLVKDPEAWNVMCKWWAFMEFRTISEWNRHNR